MFLKKAQAGRKYPFPDDDKDEWFVKLIGVLFYVALAVGVIVFSLGKLAEIGVLSFG